MTLCCLFVIINSMKALNCLHSNTQTLHELVKNLQCEIGTLKQQIQTLATEKETLKKANEHLDILLKQARQWRFGRKTEHFSAEQLSLLDEDIDTDISTLEAKITKTLPYTPQTQSPHRRPLPEHLAREEITLEPESSSSSCECGHELRFIRDEINEVVDYIPGRFIVRRTIRPQYSCSGCQSIHSAQLPVQLIDKGQAGTGLLTQIVINKCIDHLPLYRQHHIFMRDGIDIPTSTLSEWMGKIGVALEPLVDRLHELLLRQSVLHADETPLTILSAKEGKSTRGYLWAYATTADSKRRSVVFDCQSGRSGQYARDFLKDFSGTFMVDDYGGYKALFATGRIKEAGCLTHVRRKFFEQYQVNNNPIAKTVLESIKALYQLESLIKHRPPDKKQRWRERYAKPRLDDLQKWLQIKQQQTAPNSGIYKAITHALKRWSALQCYLNDGNVPIDNNHIENCIRPIAVGRKNWLFAGSLRAGQRMAGIMSLLHTAKLNGIDPFVCLHYVLTHLPLWKNNRLDELLPFAENAFTE